jgi:hypothetical protein
MPDTAIFLGAGVSAAEGAPLRISSGIFGPAEIPKASPGIGNFATHNGPRHSPTGS